MDTKEGVQKQGRWFSFTDRAGTRTSLAIDHISEIFVDIVEDASGKLSYRIAVRMNNGTRWGLGWRFANAEIANETLEAILKEIQ